MSITRRDCDRFVAEQREKYNDDPIIGGCIKRIVEHCEVLSWKYFAWSDIFDRWTIAPTTKITQTMCTTGPHLFFNPMFVGKCDNERLSQVLIHEAAHVFLKHHLIDIKLYNGNPKTVNAGADAAIHGLFPDLFSKLRGIASFFPGCGRLRTYPVNKTTEWYIDRLLADGIISDSAIESPADSFKLPKSGDDDENGQGCPSDDEDYEDDFESGDGDESDADGEFDAPLAGDEGFDWSDMKMDDQSGDDDDGDGDGSDTEDGISDATGASDDDEGGFIPMDDDSGATTGAGEGEDTGDGDGETGTGSGEGQSLEDKLADSIAQDGDDGGFAVLEDLDAEYEGAKIDSECGQWSPGQGEGYDPLQPKGGIKAVVEQTSDLPERLADIFDDMVNECQSYNRPRRRGYQEDVLLPCNQTRSLGNVAILVDTSYSMTNAMVLAGFQRVNEVLEAYPSTNIFMFQCSTQIDFENVIELEPGEKFRPEDIDRTCSGGTDLTRALIEIEDYCEPSVIVVWSDMQWSVECTLEPQCKVLWANTAPEDYNGMFCDRHEFGEECLLTKGDLR